MIGLAGFLLIAVTTVMVAYIGGVAILYREYRDPAMAMSQSLTAYWTLVGAIPVLISKMRSAAKPYTYLEGRLFPIVADRDYLTTILAYSTFLLGSLLITSLCARRPIGAHDAELQWVTIARRFSHLCALAGLAVGSFLRLIIVVRLIRAGGTSIYETTRIARGDMASWVRLYQYLNIATAYTLACAAALWLSLPSARRGRPATRRLITVGYSILGLVVLAENAILGNRAVPLVVGGAVACGWLRWRYAPADRRRRTILRRRAALMLVAGVLAIGTIGISRGGSLSTPAAVAGSLTQNITRPGNVVLQEFRSSEKVAAHMSLYGVIREGPVVVGPSWDDSYKSYAELVQAPKDQVFTLHFVTGWWLWAGPLGLLMATVSFGLGLALLQRLATGRLSRWNAGARVAAATLPGVGFAVTVSRSGPESLRAVLFELVLIPAAALTVCFLVGHARTHALS